MRYNTNNNQKLTQECNCDYIIQLVALASSRAATCPHVYHTQWRLHIVPLIAKRQAGKL